MSVTIWPRALADSTRSAREPPGSVEPPHKLGAAIRGVAIKRRVAPIPGAAERGQAVDPRSGDAVDAQRQQDVRAIGGLFRWHCPPPVRWPSGGRHGGAHPLPITIL